MDDDKTIENSPEAAIMTVEGNGNTTLNNHGPVFIHTSPPPELPRPLPRLSTSEEALEAPAERSKASQPYRFGDDEEFVLEVLRQTSPQSHVEEYGRAAQRFARLDQKNMASCAVAFRRAFKVLYETLSTKAPTGEGFEKSPAQKRIESFFGAYTQLCAFCDDGPEDVETLRGIVQTLNSTVIYGLAASLKL